MLLSKNKEKNSESDLFYTFPSQQTSLVSRLCSYNFWLQGRTCTTVFLLQRPGKKSHCLCHPLALWNLKWFNTNRKFPPKNTDPNMTFSKEEQAKRENGQKTVISSPNSKTSLSPQTPFCPVLPRLILLGLVEHWPRFFRVEASKFSPLHWFLKPHRRMKLQPSGYGQFVTWL